MKHSRTPDRPAQFTGTLRRYTSSSPQRQRTWDDWVEGTVAKPRDPIGRLKMMLKISGIIGGILALGGIALALFIELS
jgi:hypothetical protein